MYKFTREVFHIKELENTIETKCRMQSYNFKIGPLTIPYQLIDNDRAKHIKISMSVDGMKVSKPKRVKFEEVEKLLQTKEKWIYKHYTELQAMKVEKCKRDWQSGESILYKGESYDIRVFTYEQEKTVVKFNDENFEVYINKELSEEEKKRSIETQFRKWFVNCAVESIEERLNYYRLKMGVQFSRVTIREQKTRWGSCSSKGNLNFNWKLIMAPQWVMDYVVVHELCHLRYLNHSKEFWNMVGLYMPEYKKAQQWLKMNGMRLGV